MSEKPMMGCGHAANAVRKRGDGVDIPVCVICIGVVAGADVVVAGPDLTGRMSKCHYCGKTGPSRLSLPFFAHKPDAPFDDHYDGCMGWD